MGKISLSAILNLRTGETRQTHEPNMVLTSLFTILYRRLIDKYYEHWKSFPFLREIYNIIFAPVESKGLAILGAADH